MSFVCESHGLRRMISPIFSIISSALTTLAGFSFNPPPFLTEAPEAPTTLISAKVSPNRPALSAAPAEVTMGLRTAYELSIPNDFNRITRAFRDARERL